MRLHVPGKGGRAEWTPKPAGTWTALPTGAKEWVRRGLTLLTPESPEAGVALAGVVVDSLHTLTVATAGCRGAGSCRKRRGHRCAYNAVLGVQEQQCMTEKSPVTGTARDFN